MATRQITIDAAQGKANAYVSHPDAGEHPPVLLYVDGMGLRPAFREIADRIAAKGYHVLAPDLFYRTPDAIVDPPTFFNNPDARATWQKTVLPTVTPANVMADTDAYLAYFDSQKNIRGEAIGITGYCLGGRMAVYAAGHYGDRVAAAAAFHPGGLATDAPDSPHRLASKITGALHIGGAIEDRSFDDAQKERLRAALDTARVNYTLETYPARHGWVPRDTPVHDPEQAERHFGKLFELLRSTLEPPGGGD